MHNHIDDQFELGWKWLRQGQLEQSEDFFQEIYDDDPTSKEARLGLIETYKARYILYRIALKLRLRNPKALVEGINFSSSFISIIITSFTIRCIKLAGEQPEIAGIAWTIAVISFLTLLAIYTVNIETTLRLWSTPHGRKTLKHNEYLGALLSGTFVVLAASMMLIYSFVGHMAFVILTIFFFLLSESYDRVLRTESGVCRMITLVYVFIISLCGIASTFIIYSQTEGKNLFEVIPPLGGILLLVTIVGCACTGAISNFAVYSWGARPSTIDFSTSASNPGGVRLSHVKLKILHPEFYGFWTWFMKIINLEERTTMRDLFQSLSDHIMYGDSRAAIVIKENPLFIAAYSDDLDTVCILYFMPEIALTYNLREGDRLLSINTYDSEDSGNDLMIGKNANTPWKNFWPIIADFVSDDLMVIAERKRKISETEWNLAYKLGQTFFDNNYVYRDGRPAFSYLSNVNDDEF